MVEGSEKRDVCVWPSSLSDRMDKNLKEGVKGCIHRKGTNDKGFARCNCPGEQTNNTSAQEFCPPYQEYSRRIARSRRIVRI